MTDLITISILHLAPTNRIASNAPSPFHQILHVASRHITHVASAPPELHRPSQTLLVCLATASTDVDLPARSGAVVEDGGHKAVAAFFEPLRLRLADNDIPGRCSVLLLTYFVVRVRHSTLKQGGLWMA